MSNPMYRQIADDLRLKIESGEVAPGAQLPTEVELMNRYSASRNAIRDAIKLLHTQGLVESRPGQGTFTVQKLPPDRSQVISRSQQRFVDSTPWSLQTSFYPMRLVETGAADLVTPGGRSPSAIQDQETLKRQHDLGLDYPVNMTFPRHLDVDQEALGEPDDDS
jgi:DNA-binding transcriptional MocR family regulator